ncbi:hypothetical protein [Tautonia marina]|uniref:hypothetical protein n=1 Tax=Tautonia marina TaxID=2653855 RepID=UPI001261394A|nr:hypothetical protein [Tautonia marina]
MNKLLCLFDSPYRGLTPLSAGIHGLIAAGLASMAMSVVMAKHGLPSAPVKRPSEVYQPAEPVVLRKNGYVIYDSHERAEVIAEVWNITPENIDSYKRWW